jgi:hypothetical protein
MSAKLKFYSTERISLCAEKDGAFVLVGRYSLGPTLNTPGQASYPIDQGYLGKAWQDAWAESGDLPNPQTHPEEWLDAQEATVPRPRAEALHMRSRRYAAIRLEHSAPGHAPFGVVVFESQLVSSDPAAPSLTKADLSAMAKKDDGQRLRILLEQGLAAKY